MLVFSSAALSAPRPKTDDTGREPTKAELEAAKEEFAKWGAKYVYWQPSPTLSKARHCFVFGSRTTLDTLKHLPEVPFAHLIDLSQVEFQDGWLADLPGARGLRAVCINSNPTLTDTWVEWLVGLKRLERFYLFDCKKVTDAGVRALARSETLRAVRLGQMKISEEALRVLIHSPRLEDLSLDWCEGVTDSLLKEVAGLNDLRSLNLFGCEKISSGGVQHLAVLRRLQTLSVGLTKVGDEGMKAVARMESLETLQLYFTPITDAGVAELGRLQRLRHIDLSRCNAISDRGVEELAKHQELRSVELNGCSKVTDTGLKTLGQLRELREVNLGACRLVTDVGLREINGLPELRYVYLDGVKVTDAGVRAFLTKHTDLEWLGLSDTAITDGTVKELADFKKLRGLGISGCGGVTDESVSVLAKMKQLEYLDAMHSSITPEGDLTLRNSLPKCAIHPGNPRAE